MNRTSRFWSTALTLLLFALLLNVLLYLGCKKKQDQPAKTPPAPALEQPASPDKQIQQMPAVESNVVKPAGKVPPAPKPAAAATPTDVNRSAQVPKTSNKETTRLLAKRKKTAPPTELPAADAVREPVEMNIEQFATLTDPEEKIKWISEFSDAHPESTAAMAEKALNDDDAEVRSAAMESLVDNESPDSLDVVYKAMKDKEEQVREQAIEACEYVEDERVGDILVSALGDESEMVRSAVFQVAELKNADTRLNVYNAGITSRYEDVKDATVSSLVDMSTHGAVDVLITGLRDTNPDFREDVGSALDFLIGQEFASYQQAKNWWDANRRRFDDELNELDE